MKMIFSYGYVNKQNYQRKENPNVDCRFFSLRKNFRVGCDFYKRNSPAILWMNCYTGQSYKELLESKFFPHAKKLYICGNIEAIISYKRLISEMLHIKL